MRVACPTATRVNNFHVASPALADGPVTPAASKASVTYFEALTRKYLASVSVNIILKQMILLLCGFLLCGIGVLRKNI